MSVFSNDIKNSGFLKILSQNLLLKIAYALFLQVTECALSNHARKLEKIVAENFQLRAP